MPDSNETHLSNPPQCVPPVADVVTLDGRASAESADVTRVKGDRGEPARGDRGQAVAGYEIEREIARGGMGVVYAARDHTFGREVAVKVMLPGMSAAAFDREARITARLQHPGIPPVHALGALADGRPYLVMKLIRGDTLKDLLERSADAPADRTRLLVAFAQMCQAVGYAHAQGIVHRDLKPANIMVGAFGEVQVMDWGLARAVVGDPASDGGETGAVANAAQSERARDDAQKTAAGVVKGTPAYMAPEQARGEPVDARADVFALGGILAAILTGHPPFAGASAGETIVRAARAELAETFDRLDTSGADAELVVLCKRCLAAEPAERFPDGTALTEAVAVYRAGVSARLRKAEQERAAAEAHARAELKRQADLKAAEDEARAQQRETRADALLDEMLMASDASAVPRLVAELKEFADLTGPKLRASAAEPVGTRAGLHARLALATEPARAAELAAHVPECAPDELPVLAQFLKPHASAVASGLWGVVEDAGASGAKRVRAAGALAALAPDDERWGALAPAVADAATRATPTEFVALLAALEPVRDRLVPVLMARYPELRREIESGKLDLPGLVGAATAFDRAANLLARYAHRPEHLAELALLADPRHFELFAPAVRAKQSAVMPVLLGELATEPPEQLGADQLDAALEVCGKRRGYAAAVLLAHGEGARVWPLFAYPTGGDPTARSYLLERLTVAGADARALVARCETEANVSALRALLVALGDYPLAAVPTTEREALVAHLLVQYREHPDPGLHGAIDWLLRQRWDKAHELAPLDAELARAPVAGAKDWFVNGEGQTFAVVRGPVEFTMGSPLSEPGRSEAQEPPHAKRISRTFAVATKQVTVEQYLRFRPRRDWIERYSPGPDTPAVSMTWYSAAEYCNWLSAREGLPRDQWCYEPNAQGSYAEGMRIRPGHLNLTGYRLPTEAEWEFACRGGAVPARYYGRGTELLPRYSWFVKTSDDRTWPVGRLRPNELGLFDTLGNVWEWCEDPTYPYAIDRCEDVGASEGALLDERTSRVLRGGSFNNQPVNVRSAYRNIVMRLENRYFANGFRPVRTLA